MKTEKDVTLTNDSWFDAKAKIFDENRFGAMSIMMIFQSCLASIAAGLVLDMESVIPLIITVMTAMAANSIFIAQMPAKWCIGGFVISVVANLPIIILALVFR